jgi:M6 family metalloprotease-like protein
MKPIRISLIGSPMMIMILLSSVHPVGVKALEPPSREQIEQYKKDNMLDELTKRAFAYKNHLVSQDIVRRYKYNVHKTKSLMEGVPSYEFDRMYGPPPAWEGLPTTGNVKILALLIDFKDYRHTDMDNANSMYSKLFGEGEGDFPYESLRNYYLRSSYNQLKFQGNVLGWYTTSYARDDMEETAVARENLIKEALTFYDSQGHDFSQYDNDNNGSIDYLVVIWAGPHGPWATFWWGYKTNYQNSGFTIDGKTLSDYSWQFESYLYPEGYFNPLVVIHETGHALGLPDLYDYTPGDEPYNEHGAGGLDMMDLNYGDHNCFSKFLLEWIDPMEFNNGVHKVSLNSSGNSKDALQLMAWNQQPEIFTEFFMVQNRYRTNDGNDIKYPNDGLVIWHIDATLNDDGTNFKYNNSNTEHKLVRLMEADGFEEIDAGSFINAGDYYITGDEFSPSSEPNNNMYNERSGEFRLYDIGNVAPLMTFKVDYPYRYTDPFEKMNLLCAIIGCDGFYRPFEEYINPSGLFRRALRKHGTKADQLRIIKQKSLQLSTRINHANKESEIQLIEKRATKLLKELQALGIGK